MMQGNIREKEISHTLWGSLLLLTGACRSNKSISPGSTESKTSNGDSIEYGRMVDYEERGSTGEPPMHRYHNIRSIVYT